MRAQTTGRLLIALGPLLAAGCFRRLADQEAASAAAAESRAAGASATRSTEVRPWAEPPDEEEDSSADDERGAGDVDETEGEPGVEAAPAVDLSADPDAQDEDPEGVPDGSDGD